jgi:hypothetical protein
MHGKANMPDETYNEPSKVAATGGEVHVRGPDGVDVALTPDAAAETSDRLLHASAQAQGQRIEAGKERWKEIDHG